MKKLEDILKEIKKVKPFINRYNLEGINNPLEGDDWKKFEKNNITIAQCFVC